MLSPEPVPPYRKLVSATMKTLSSPIDPAGLQISEPRWIERVGGPAWIVCLKTNPRSSGAVYYAFFIQKEKVVDTRTAIGTDRCVHQDFVPFDVTAAAATAEARPPAAPGRVRHPISSAHPD